MLQIHFLQAEFTELNSNIYATQNHDFNVRNKLGDMMSGFYINHKTAGYSRKLSSSTREQSLRANLKHSYTHIGEHFKLFCTIRHFLTDGYSGSYRIDQAPSNQVDTVEPVWKKT